MTPRRPAPGPRSPSGGAVRPLSRTCTSTAREVRLNSRRTPSLASQARTPTLNTSDTLTEETDDRRAVLMRHQQERARRELTLDAIRSHLAEQPSPHSIRACARRWCSDITRIADDVVKALNSTESPE